jgi:ferrous iron transport protein B
MKTFAIVGQPNAGKSTLFNVLSDIKTTTSNFAGTSVKLSECLISIYGETIKIVDLPGLYSLNYSDSAEKVTIDYLMTQNYDVVINVVDSTLLARSLELTYELSELGMPMVIALNMMDEAKNKGLEIYPEKLSEIFGLEIISVSALYGKGIKQLTERALQVSKKKNSESKIFNFTKHIEENVRIIEEKIDLSQFNLKGNRRFYAIKSIENPELIPNGLLAGLDDTIKSITQNILQNHNTDSFEVFSYERHHFAMSTAEKISKFIKKNSAVTAEKLDSFLMHPIYGYVGLAIFHLILFVTIFYVGDFLTQLLAPLSNLITSVYEPLKSQNLFIWTTIDGIVQGIIGTVGIVLPYFVPLLLLNSFFEETGYLARIAFLIDNLMHRIGLHGKSVAAFIMGIGCSVPAIYATRILDSKRDRILTALLIPFVPCSARIAVIFALTTAFAGPLWSIVIFAVVVMVIAINGKILSKFMKKPTGLILEIPQLRLPTFKVTITKTFFKVNDFLKEALPFLIIGSVVLGWIELFNVAQYVDMVFYPVLDTLLGLPEKLGSTLVFGFFRKELILVMTTQALGVDSLVNLPMTKNQIIVFIVFVTLYFPCFTTFVVLLKEFGAKIGIVSAVMSLLVATSVAMIFRIYFVLLNYLFN